MNLVSLDQLNYEAFARLVNKDLRVITSPESSMQLAVREISPRQNYSSSGAHGQTYESFSLTLSGSSEQFLPQQTYLFESPDIGRFELFIVPVKRNPQGVEYQAAFNRVAPA